MCFKKFALIGASGKYAGLNKSKFYGEILGF